MSSCVSHCDCVRSLRDIGYCSLMHAAADKKVRLDAFSVAVEVIFLWAGAKKKTLQQKHWVLFKKNVCFQCSSGFGANATLIIVHCEFREKGWGGQFVKQSETFKARH